MDKEFSAVDASPAAPTKKIKKKHRFSIKKGVLAAKKKERYQKIANFNLTGRKKSKIEGESAKNRE